MNRFLAVSVCLPTAVLMSCSHDSGGGTSPQPVKDLRYHLSQIDQTTFTGSAAGCSLSIASGLNPARVAARMGTDKNGNDCHFQVTYSKDMLFDCRPDNSFICDGPVIVTQSLNYKEQYELTIVNEDTLILTYKKMDLTGNLTSANPEEFHK